MRMLKDNCIRKKEYQGEGTPESHVLMLRCTAFKISCLCLLMFQCISPFIYMYVIISLIPYQNASFVQMFGISEETNVLVRNFQPISALNSAS